MWIEKMIEAGFRLEDGQGKKGDRRREGSKFNNLSF